jgi:hypothetical protein
LLGGKISSGKNAVYDMVANAYSDRKIERIYFAQPIKQMCERIFKEYAAHLNSIIDNASELLKQSLSFGYIEAKVIDAIKTLRIEPENWYENKTECTRMILQIVGTDIIRNEVEDTFWIRKASEEIIESNSELFIITDFRFPNELYDLKTFLDCDTDNDYELITINIERNIDRDNELIHGHESENSLADFYEWYYVIVNDKDLEYLNDCVVNVFNDILGIKYNDGGKEWLKQKKSTAI